MSTIIGLVSTFRLPLHLLAPFGLPPASPPPQSPFRSSFSLLLDFLLPPLHFKVHSATLCTSQQKVDITLYFYTSFNEHNTPYTVLESDNSESMPDVLH